MPHKGLYGHERYPCEEGKCRIRVSKAQSICFLNNSKVRRASGMSNLGTDIIFVLSFLILGDGRLVKLFYNISKGVFRKNK
jgi:hypothetical protein